MTEIPDNNQSDKSCPSQVPLHRQIAENLTKQVTMGQIKPGQKLPSERRIAHRFGASRGTVRTALQHLEQAGLITRRDRRSAVVAIRRDIKPYIRIACGNSRILKLLRHLGDLQLLPPRCHLQLLDLQQSGVIGELLVQPSSGADILFCDMEYVHGLRHQKEIFYPLPQQLTTDTGIRESLSQTFSDDGQYLSVPLSASAMVLYYNKALFRDSQKEPPQAWSWEQLTETAEHFTSDGKYGFQFRPTFAHLSSLMSRQGGELYKANGTVAAGSSATFEQTLRFAYKLLHESKVSPVLAKVDQINLFAQRRCAMAMDGFDMFGHYREQLGDDLGVTALPGHANGGSITGGIAVSALAGVENTQPIEDLLRALLNAKTQLVLAKAGAGLPVRSDLLNPSALQEIDIPLEVSEIFLTEARDFQNANMPENLEHKLTVENLFLELWLGLDNIDSICRRFEEC